MAICSFCGNEISPGTGKMFVKKDAKILYFCSRRCEKNLLKLKRNPRDMQFTKAAATAKKQHISELKHDAELKHEAAHPKVKQ